jgi:2-octaprenyl-6-methoxyphenol hydroxylase
MNHTSNTGGAAVDRVDIAICGAGPAGMALAALLAGRGVAPERIALLDARTLEQASVDPRSLALSYGSRQILEEAGAWPLEATPIHQIHVSRRGRFGRSLIERADHGVPALGYVARYGDVVSALGAACTKRGIVALRPARVLGSREDADGVTLDIEQDGVARQLRAALVVQAEGGLFADQQGRAVHRDYEQTGIIAMIRVSAPVAHRAFERFTDEGPLALLPQDGADGHRYALVWCVQPARAQHLLDLGEDAFLHELGEAFGERLGRFTHVSQRVAFPLGLNADPRATARTVAIGNAAQTLHPVAGQGLNLGLRDVAVLARVLARDTSPAALADYVRTRGTDRAMTMRVTDTLARIFAADTPVQTLLGAALGLVDLLDPARKALAELLMYGRRH